METKQVVAVDLGASSGRLVSVFFDGRTIRIQEAYRFANAPVQLLNHLYWDYLKIFQEIKYGILAAYQQGGRIDCLSVDTWGVDYGLLDKKGRLISAPHSYRDPRVLQFRKPFLAKLPAAAFFAATGTQPESIISALQLFSDISDNPSLDKEIGCVLFMPELIGYLLSGKHCNEFTISSTSGLLNAARTGWSAKILQTFGFKKAWFDTKPIANGKLLGPILPAISNEVNVPETIQIASGAGHDTAAAVLATPFAADEHTARAFISCGTWSIVGVLTKRPVVTQQAFTAGLTNEGCFGGGNRLLKNVTGLWIIQELRREWSIKGEAVSFAKMTEWAQKSSIDSLIDPNNELFTSPNAMEEKVCRFCKNTRQRVPQTYGEVGRVVIQSLALSYRLVIDQLQTACGQPIRVIHMIGGGIQNQLLCRLTAKYTGRKIIAGPVEASVIGNALAQLMTLRAINKQEIAPLIHASFATQTYTPSNEEETLNLLNRYQKLCRSVKKSKEWT